jgi:hypothetical protein
MIDVRTSRALRAGGAVVALAVTLVLCTLLVALRANVRTGAFAPGANGSPVDVTGRIEFYGHGTMTLTTATSGLREVVVDGRTRVSEPPRGVATLAALRPGRHVAVWGEPASRGGPLVARDVFVWGETK